MTNSRGAAAYARVGVESQVMASSPHALIMLLFEGASRAIRMAAVHMRRGDRARKGEAISRALKIVNNGLLDGLDEERGGELAERLHGLYAYVAQRLLEANLHDDPEALEQAGQVLETVASAWKQINPAALVNEGRP